jgi:aldose 1-epimerase
MSPPRPFGFLPTGEPVHAYTLTNPSGASATILTLGGIVTSLRVPDRHGAFADVVLGFDNLAAYVAGHPYFGAIAGRVAGRITAGRFTLDGVTYPLAINNDPNHLHGGLRGFDKHVWSATPVTRPDGADSLRLTRLSPDGEEGYPGNVTVAVTYTLTADHTLVIDSEASTDRATPFTLTHHSYFNLSGHDAGSVADHTLQIHADAFAPTDTAMTLLGRRDTVTSANDFRQPRRVGDALPQLHQHHGDLYFLPDSSVLRTAAVLADPASGRILTVTTTESCLQLYTGVSLDGTLTGKSGRPYHSHAGLCLECEGYPDGANTPALGDILLRPGTPQRHTTTYAFTTTP